MPNNFTPRFGKKPAKVDNRTLKFSKYLKVENLPPLPIADDNASKVSIWPMDGNDKYGSCVLAADEHAIRGWTTYAGSLKNISEDEVISLYLKLSPYDDGLVMLDTLNLWKKSGLWDDKIDAYVELDVGSIEQAKYAIHLFGSINIGMSLPNTNTYGPWTRISGSPNRNNGHAVILVGYDDTKKTFTAISWGTAMEMSYEWYQYYTDEAYVVLSKDWLNTKGLSPDGWDWQTLSDDLYLVTGDAPPPAPPEDGSSSSTLKLVLLSIAVLAGIFILYKLIT